MCAGLSVAKGQPPRENSSTILRKFFQHSMKSNDPSRVSLLSRATPLMHPRPSTTTRRELRTRHETKNFLENLPRVTNGHIATRREEAGREGGREQARNVDHNTRDGIENSQQEAARRREFRAKEGGREKIAPSMIPYAKSPRIKDPPRGENTAS